MSHAVLSAVLLQCWGEWLVPHTACIWIKLELLASPQEGLINSKGLEYCVQRIAPEEVNDVSEGLTEFGVCLSLPLGKQMY